MMGKVSLKKSQVYSYYNKTQSVSKRSSLRKVGRLIVASKRETH